MMLYIDCYLIAVYVLSINNFSLEVLRCFYTCQPLTASFSDANQCVSAYEEIWYHTEYAICELFLIVYHIKPSYITNYLVYSNCILHITCYMFYIEYYML